MKRVLVITYYWPPFGGSGVQRWLKFVKYLSGTGYTPVVYTPENPEYMATDFSLNTDIPKETEVLRRKIIEPYSLYRLFTGRQKGAIKPGFISGAGSGAKRVPFKERLSLFLRSNIFIPDPKALWIMPSVNYLRRYLNENPVDVIVSSGPPHSMHLIAKRLALKTGTPWVADFRDPWTKMYNFKYMGYSRLVKAIHSSLERGVLSSADAVVTVSATIGRELKESGAKILYVITNGYDPQDFPDSNRVKGEKFTLTYTGLFVKSQNPEVLWEYLGKRIKESSIFAKDLCIQLIGNTDETVLQDIKANGLENNLVIMGYMPHDQVVKMQREASVLLLSGGNEPESRGILTGKFFEYLAAGRPILGFGPKGGDMDLALEECKAGKMFSFDDKDGVAGWIERQYKHYTCEETLNSETNVAAIEKYSRINLTKEFANVLDRVIEKRKNRL